MTILPALSLPDAILVGPVSISTPPTSQSIPSTYAIIANERGPNDALAFPVISFSGLQLGSEVRVIRNFGTPAAIELGGFESYTGVETIQLPFFGSGLSTVTFQIVNLNSLFISFDLDLPRNDAVVPIVQSPDRIFSNP